MLTERDRWTMYMSACLSAQKVVINSEIIRIVANQADMVLAEEKRRYPHKDEDRVMHDAAGMPVVAHHQRAPFAEDDEEDA